MLSPRWASLAASPAGLPPAQRRRSPTSLRLLRPPNPSSPCRPWTRPDCCARVAACVSSPLCRPDSPPHRRHPFIYNRDSLSAPANAQVGDGYFLLVNVSSYGLDLLHSAYSQTLGKFLLVTTGFSLKTGVNTVLALAWNNKTVLHFLPKGDDNGCNIGADLLGSPPKQSKPSPRKLGFDENSPLPTRRQLVPSSPRLSPAAKPSPKRQETPSRSPAHHNPEKKAPVARLFAESESFTTVLLFQTQFHRLSAPSSPSFFFHTGSRFQSVKQALHTAVPERLLSRDDERASIRSFLEEKVLQRLPGSLYISGAPGTGKTACLNCVLQEMKVLRRNQGGKRKTQRFLTVQ